MRLILNGTEGNSLTYLRGSDLTLQVQVLNDDGSPLTLVSPANATLQFMLAPTRTDTPDQVIAVTPGAGQANGLGTAPIEDTVTTLVRGTTYYVWGQWKSGAGTGGGTTVLLSNTPSTLTVR